MSAVEHAKTKMLASIEHLKNELKSIRTGRANPSMLDGVQVEVYGSMMRIKELASVTAPEARMLLITPFDPRNSSTIGKSIEKANLGVQVITEGNCVRVKISPMDENTRKEMVKVCLKRLEEAKVSIRSVRRESNEMLKKQKADGHVEEDMMKKLEKTIQELTDKSCKDVDDIGHKKEIEILTI